MWVTHLHRVERLLVVICFLMKMFSLVSVWLFTG